MLVENILSQDHYKGISTEIKGQGKRTHRKSVTMTVLCESYFLKLQVLAH